MNILGLLKNLAGTVIRIGYKLTYKLISIDEKMVIFISFHGRGYSDNPRAIFEEMIKDPRFKNYRFIWFIKYSKKKDLDIPRAKVVEYFSLSYFYYMSKAKYWVINCKMPDYIYKKEGQIYLQTWHGTPLKKLGHDIDLPEGTTFYRSGVSYEEMTHQYDIDASKYDYMVSPNQFCTKIFPHAFNVDPNKLIETGYPRNDFMCNATKDDIKKMKDKFNLPTDKKIVLYAPTFRDNSFVAGGYIFELEADFHKWKAILGDDYIVIFKPHYLVVNKYKDDASLEGFLYSIDHDAEINELYVVADCLVTDYSSAFFDYAVLNRPIYFYMYDLEAYKNELRGIYLNMYEDLPGHIYKEEEAMLYDIRDGIFDYDRLEAFNKIFSHQQHGDSSKRVINIVFGDDIS